MPANTSVANGLRYIWLYVGKGAVNIHAYDQYGLRILSLKHVEDILYPPATTEVRIGVNQNTLKSFDRCSLNE